MPRPLPVPSFADADDAIELIRVFVSAGSPHITLATDVWDDPAAWGILMVDVMRHVARSYGGTVNMDHDAVLKRIREGFDAEWSHET